VPDQIHAVEIATDRFVVESAVEALGKNSGPSVRYASEGGG
jgi:hypothetical protein